MIVSLKIQSITAQEIKSLLSRLLPIVSEFESRFTMKLDAENEDEQKQINQFKQVIGGL